MRLHPEANSKTAADIDAVTPVLTLLQGYLANAPLPVDGRLPPERDLATTLGVSRPEIRKALAVLESDGQLWRHVGKGTFLGPRPMAAIGGIAALAGRMSPDDLLRARIALEPQLSGLAALEASEPQIAILGEATRRARTPGLSWRQFEVQDATFHRLIAEATANPALVHLFDELSALRRAVTWDRPRTRPEGPPPDHHSFDDHERIVAAIAARDTRAAATAMSDHLEKVHARLKTGLDGVRPAQPVSTAAPDRSP